MSILSKFVFFNFLKLENYSAQKRILIRSLRILKPYLLKQLKELLLSSNSQPQNKLL